jgi:hypothetical protein
LGTTILQLARRPHCEVALGKGSYRVAASAKMKQDRKSREIRPVVALHGTRREERGRNP